MDGNCFWGKLLPTQLDSANIWPAKIIPKTPLPEMYIHVACTEERFLGQIKFPEDIYAMLSWESDSAQCHWHNWPQHGWNNLCGRRTQSHSLNQSFLFSLHKLIHHLWASTNLFMNYLRWPRFMYNRYTTMWARDAALTSKCHSFEERLSLLITRLYTAFGTGKTGQCFGLNVKCTRCDVHLASDRTVYRYHQLPMHGKNNWRTVQLPFLRYNSLQLQVRYFLRMHSCYCCACK